MRNLPPSIEAAKLMKRLRYQDGSVCSGCNQAAPRYVRSDDCVVCCKQEAADYFNDAIASGFPGTPLVAIESGHDCYVTNHPCESAGHVGLKMLDGRCKMCMEESKSPREEARKARKTYYMPTDPCTSGHLSLRRVVDDQCKQCLNLLPKKSLSARSEARKAGRKEYIPDTICSAGFHTSVRRVADDLCFACRELTRASEGVTKAYIDRYPKGPLDRTTAHSLGFKAYYDESLGRWLNTVTGAVW